MNAIELFKYFSQSLIGLALITFTLSLPAYAEKGDEEIEGHGESEEHDEAYIELSSEQIEHADLELAKVQPGSLKKVLKVYGTVKLNPEGSQHVSARFDGQILKINKSIGDAVTRGETLLTIEANESMQRYPLNAAIDGIVVERHANSGEQTNGRTLLEIEDLSSVWVELALFPTDVQDVRVGQTVRLSEKNELHSSEGVISYIAPRTNTSTQTITARVPLENAEGHWTPGKFVIGEIVLAETSASLLIEKRAIQIVEDRSVVFVQEEEGFEPRPVTLGKSDLRFAEVLEGLHSGETYVTKNSFVLKSELGKEDAEDGH
jgi:membrane fusion protein, heavy metal efflux system